MKIQTITKPVIALVGPTAIGKTALSLEIAKRFDCEIISVDSMQVYRFMDIGTAKATKEERARVPHHLLDIVMPDERYDAACFVRDCLTSIRKIQEKNKVPLLTGGTGMYLKALVEGLFEGPPSDDSLRDELLQKAPGSLYGELQKIDPESAARIHENDTQRIIRALEVYMLTGIPLSQHFLRQKKRPEKELQNVLQIGLTTERKVLYNRINKRSGLMLELGLQEEVEGLLAQGFSRELKSMQSIGYKHMINYLTGKWTKEVMLELLARDTRRYAKRQYTWFNKVSGLRWMDVNGADAVLRNIDTWLKTVE